MNPVDVISNALHLLGRFDEGKQCSYSAEDVTTLRTAHRLLAIANMPRSKAFTA
jgi:hypothetical protein